MKTMSSYSIETGDVSDVLSSMGDESFDGCLCDPPYGLSFMGKAWDHGVPSAEVWAEVKRVLKPGAFLLAFGGTRTFHRLTCAIEDAGFEVRDCLMWLYGSGFPKSHDISKGIDKAAGAEREVVGESSRHGGGTLSGGAWNIPAEVPKITAPATDAARTWNGYGTALKPAWEPCIVAMKPLDGTFANNALRHGVAGINVEAGRIAGEVPSVPQPSFKSPTGQVYGFQTGEGRNGEMSSATNGRWPANLILDESFDQEWSRFFYCAKASRRERDAGLDGFEAKAERQASGRKSGRSIVDGVWVETGSEPLPVRNSHPCLKPLDLNRYFASLMLPPKGHRRLLVPFSGSGSEMIGALQAGWDEAVGIEKEPEYVEIAKARLKHWTSIGSLFDE